MQDQGAGEDLKEEGQWLAAGIDSTEANRYCVSPTGSHLYVTICSRPLQIITFLFSPHVMVFMS